MYARNLRARKTKNKSHSVGQDSEKYLLHNTTAKVLDGVRSDKMYMVDANKD